MHDCDPGPSRCWTAQAPPQEWTPSFFWPPSINYIREDLVLETLTVLVPRLLHGQMSLQCFWISSVIPRTYLLTQHGKPNIPQMGVCRPADLGALLDPYQRIQEMPHRRASNKESPCSLQHSGASKLGGKSAAFRESSFLGSRGSLVGRLLLAQAMLSGSCCSECSDKLMPKDPIWPSLTTIPYRSLLPFKLQGGKDWALTVELFFRISWMVLKAAKLLLSIPPAASPDDNENKVGEGNNVKHLKNQTCKRRPSWIEISPSKVCTTTPDGRKCRLNRILASNSHQRHGATNKLLLTKTRLYYAENVIPNLSKKYDDQQWVEITCRIRMVSWFTLRVSCSIDCFDVNALLGGRRRESGQNIFTLLNKLWENFSGEKWL